MYASSSPISHFWKVFPESEVSLHSILGHQVGPTGGDSETVIITQLAFAWPVCKGPSGWLRAVVNHLPKQETWVQSESGGSWWATTFCSIFALEKILGQRGACGLPPDPMGSEGGHDPMENWPALH